MTTDTQTNIELTITPRGQQNIRNMADKVRQISFQHGETSKEATESAVSLASCLARVFELGGRIMGEDDLSLYCTNRYIDYGVNWSERSGTWSVNS